MRKVSTLVGTIISPEPIEYGVSEATGEKFLCLRASFRAIEMDVVISEFIYHGETGRIQITGGLCTDSVKDAEGNTITHNYIFAKDIQKVDDSEEETNEIYVSAKITKNHKYLVSQAGLELLFLYATIIDAWDRVSVVKLCVKGDMARKYRDIKPGSFLKGYGYMKTYKDRVEILINTITEAVITDKDGSHIVQEQPDENTESDNV